MKLLRSLAVSALLMFAGSGAFAQTIDDDTKCETLVAITQASSPSGKKAKEATAYIEETMRGLDRLHGQRGKAEIFPQMTEDDRSSLVQTVIMRCHTAGPSPLPIPPSRLTKRCGQQGLALA